MMNEEGVENGDDEIPDNEADEILTDEGEVTLRDEEVLIDVRFMIFSDG